MTSKTATPPHEQPGYRFAPWKTSVDAERQARYHAAAWIDTARFGDRADISVLANDLLKGARSPDDLGNPRLHYGVRVRQQQPLPLGMPLEVRATVSAIEHVNRGRLIRIAFSFEAPDGTVPVEMEHRSLILDPEPEGAGPAGAVDRDWQGAEALRQVQMTLGSVSGYSAEFPYLEGHHSYEAAKRIGMRAPIAQGLHGFTLLMAEIAGDLGGAPSVCDIEAVFRRPIFCDDAVQLVGRRDGGSRLTDLAVLNPAGKPTTQVKVHQAEP
jgi:acyl dehydratase